MKTIINFSDKFRIQDETEKFYHKTTTNFRDKGKGRQWNKLF